MQYLNETEVARMTGISIFTLRNWRFMKKHLPYSKIGRSVRYSAEDVQSFMNEHKINFNA